MIDMERSPIRPEGPLPEREGVPFWELDDKITVLGRQDGPTAASHPPDAKKTMETRLSGRDRPMRSKDLKF